MPYAEPRAFNDPAKGRDSLSPGCHTLGHAPPVKNNSARGAPRHVVKFALLYPESSNYLFRVRMGTGSASFKMATLIHGHAGIRAFYDAGSGRIFGLDDALGPKQHRSSCETYPDVESARVSFFDSSVRWEEWTKGWPRFNPRAEKTRWRDSRR
jgi:hypothetical protein